MGQSQRNPRVIVAKLGLTVLALTLGFVALVLRNEASTVLFALAGLLLLGRLGFEVVTRAQQIAERRRPTIESAGE